MTGRIMLRILADENFNGRIVRALFLNVPELDLVRVQDVGLSGASDPEVLEWAAENGRLLLTHDYETIPKYAYERVTGELPMPGVVIAESTIAISTAVEDILLLAGCGVEGEFETKILYLPLQ